MNNISFISTMECKENHWYSLPTDLRDDGIQLLEKAVSVCNRRLVSADALSEKLPIQLDLYRRRIRFSGISGFLNLGSVSVTIRPKFMGEEEHWVSRLSNALVLSNRPGRLIILPGTLSSKLLPSRFVDPFAHLFARSLLKALDSHPLLAYQRINRDLSFVRGRIYLHKQLIKLPNRQHKVSCSFSEFTKNNEYIHLLRWAIIVFQRIALTRETQISLSAALDRLPQVENCEFFQFSMLKPLPPGMSIYREPFELALELLRAHRRSVSSIKTNKRICGAVAIMHECFEAIVSYLYRRISSRIGIKTLAQSTWKLVERSGPGLGNGSLCVRPDDILFCSVTVRPILVSDSKYVGRIGTEAQAKKHKLDAGNFYQVICSCIAAGTRSGLIVQPFIEDLDENVPKFERWETTDSLQIAPISIGVLRLDFRVLNLPNGFRMLEEQLETGVRNMVVLPERI